jgi:hypothetical protein
MTPHPHSSMANFVASTVTATMRDGELFVAAACIE